MPQLVPPHGSESVKPLLLPEAERADERKRAEKLKKIPLDSRAVSDVFMFAMGAYTPLDGFMSHDDWRGSCIDMKMSNGVFWPIPITLPVDKALADSIQDLDGTFSFLVSTKDEIGYAKDNLAAKPMVMYEDDGLVAIASEEVSLNRLFPGRSLATSEPAPGTYRTWRRSI